MAIFLCLLLLISAILTADLRLLLTVIHRESLYLVLNLGQDGLDLTALFQVKQAEFFDLDTLINDGSNGVDVNFFDFLLLLQFCKDDVCQLGEVAWHLSRRQDSPQYFLDAVELPSELGDLDCVSVDVIKDWNGELLGEFELAKCVHYLWFLFLLLREALKRSFFAHQQRCWLVRIYNAVDVPLRLCCIFITTLELASLRRAFRTCSYWLFSPCLRCTRDLLLGLRRQEARADIRRGAALELTLLSRTAPCRYV